MMSWSDTKVNGDDIIDAEDYNSHVTETLRISGNYAGHSGNKDIHFPSSQIVSWLDNVYAPTGTTDTSWSGASGYAGHSSNSSIHYPSSSIKTWFDNVYAPTGLTGDTSSQVYLVSGITSDHAIYHDGVTTYLYASGLSSTQINQHYIGDTPYTTLHNWLDLLNSPGYLSGGTIWDVGSEQFSVSGGYGLLRVSDNDFDHLYMVSWEGVYNQSTTRGAAKYVGVEYNGGSPQISIKDEDTWNYDDEWPIGIVSNRSGQLCVLNNPWSVIDNVTNIIERFQSYGNVERDRSVGGLILGYSGATYITCTSGKIWSRFNEFDISNYNSSGLGNGFVQFIHKANGNYTVYSEDQNTLLYNYYDPIDEEGLVELDNNQYSIAWFYVLAEGKYVCILADSEYSNVATAETASPPSSVPVCVEKQGLLVGRVIYKEGIATPIGVQSAFDTTFVQTYSADHGQLAGLGDDDHPHYYNQSRIATISSQARQGYLFSSASDLFNSTLYMLSSSIISNYAPSTLTKTRYDNYIGHSSNTSIHFTKETLDDDYYPSSLGNAISSSYYSHSSNTSIHLPSTSIYITESQITDLGNYTTSTGTVSSWADVSSSAYSELNLAYYPSSLGNGLYTSYTAHSSNSGIHLASSQIHITESQITDLGAYTTSSGTVNTWADISSQASHTDLQDIGTNTHSQIDSHIEDTSIHIVSSNLYIDSTHLYGDIPDSNITQSSVVQYSSNMTITESQINDLDHYTDSDVDSHLVGGTGITYNAGDISVDGYTTISSQAKGGAWFSSNSDVFDSTSYMLSSTIISNYAPSTLSKTRYDSYYGHSSNTDIHFTAESLANIYYPSSLGNSLSTSYYGHSANTLIHYPSGGLKTWFDTLYAGIGAGGDVSSQITLADTLNFSDGNIYHDGVAGTLSVVSSNLYIDATQLYGNVPDASITETSVTQYSSNVTITESQIVDLAHFTTSDLTGDVADAGSSKITITNGDNRIGAGDNLTIDINESNLDISGTINTHITDTSNPHAVAWSDVSVAAISDLDDNYYPSSLGNSLSSSFWAHSSQTNKHIDWTVDQGATNIHTGNYTNTTYTAGSLLDLDGTTFNVDLSELTDGTSDIVGTEDEIVYLDNGVQKRKQVSEWTLSDFNNDSGWTTNTGTVDTSGSPVDNDFAKFTDSNTIEGRSYAETLSDLSAASNTLNNLGTVAVNTSIISDTNNTDDLGSVSKKWKGIYGVGISGTNISGSNIHGIVPMTYSIANIYISAQQNINLAKFKCPAGKKAYIYQAYACCSGGTGVDKLYVEMLADSSLPLTGADTVYKTSSAELQQGNPLASCDAGDYVELRFMYSGAGVTGVQYGTSMIQVGVY